MGSGSFLASVANQSLLPSRHPSKLALAAQALHDFLALQLDHGHAQQKQHLLAAHPLIHSFHSALAARLHHLQLRGSGNAHLNWLLDALASTLTTHSTLLSLVRTASPDAGASTDEPASSAASVAAAASLAKHRADEMLCMLDVCKSLKQVAHDIDSQLARLHRAAQRVGEALASGKPLSSCRIRGAARKLSASLTQNGHPHLDLSPTSTNKLHRTLAEARAFLFLGAKTESHSPTSCTNSDPAAILLNQAFDGAMLTSRLVLAAALSSLAPPSPKKSSGTVGGACKIITKYLRGERSTSVEWASPLGQLHHDLRQEEKNTAGGSLHQELQGLHCAAMDVQTALTGCAVLQGAELAAVKQRVESLRKGLEEAQACIQMLGNHMGSFSQALVALRLALLDRMAAY